MRGYCGVYESFSTWSGSDYKPFERLKFVWSYVSKIWPHIGSEPPKIFGTRFLEEPNLSHYFLGTQFLAYLAWFVPYAFLDQFFEIALWVLFLFAKP